MIKQSNTVEHSKANDFQISRQVWIYKNIVNYEKFLFTRNYQSRFNFFVFLWLFRFSKLGWFSPFITKGEGVSLRTPSFFFFRAHWRQATWRICAKNMPLTTRTFFCSYDVSPCPEPGFSLHGAESIIIITISCIWEIMWSLTQGFFFLSRNEKKIKPFKCVVLEKYSMKNPVLLFFTYYYYLFFGGKSTRT